MTATAPSSAESALRRYCAPLVVHEYDACTTAEQKQALLAAVMSTQRDNLLQVAVMAEMKGKKQSQQERSAKTSSTEKNCPLVRAFLEIGVQASMLCDENAIDTCRRSMATWGTVKTSLLHYQQTAQRLKQDVEYASSKVGGSGKHFMNTDKTVTKQGHKIPKWSSLRQISVSKLSMFRAAVGCYIQGVVVGEAIQPMVGGTVLLQDDNDDGSAPSSRYIVVAFYNLLPAGICGVDAEQLLRVKFPMGATVRVAEPFLKIFRDGSRGIRVDDPSDIVVERQSATTVQSSDQDLLKAKNKGNRFVAKKQFDAAVDVYLTALRAAPDLIPTVLSNRAQAYISLEQWGPAFCDASASLTIRPSCKKTWARYKLSRTHLTEQCQNETREFFASVIECILPPSPDEACDIVDATRGNELKLSGNKSFQKKDYVNAIVLYSKSLRAAGGTNRALLSNWSHCALEIGCIMDAIASASASIRISVDEKTIFRLATGLAYLGEYELAIRVASLLKPLSDRLYSLMHEAKAMQKLLDNDSLRDGRCLATNDPPLLLANFIGPVATYLTETKGRGLRATRDLKMGEILLVQRPIASVGTSIGSENAPMLGSFFGNKMDSGSTTNLKAALIHRTQRDRVLSQILGRLSDGSKGHSLVSLRELTLHLDVCSPMLPGHHEYQDDTEASQLSAEKLEKIVNVNSHGSGAEPAVTDASQLLPMICMMNHSRKPNAVFLPFVKKLGSAAVVAAMKHVKKGEEICLRYLDDEALVLEKWGVMH